MTDHLLETYIFREEEVDYQAYEKATEQNHAGGFNI